MTAALALLKRFWYVAPLLGLLITVLVMRNTLTDKTAKLEAAQVRVTDLTAANKSLSTALTNYQATVERMRVDNDAIAAAVAGKISVNNTREIHIREVIEKAVRDDPIARDWGNSPLPDSVRGSLRPNSVSQ